MTKETLDLIHLSYQEALTQSRNIIQIVENLYNILLTKDVADKDSQSFDGFIDALRNCLQMRKMTSEITDVIIYITITICIVISSTHI